MKSAAKRIKGIVFALIYVAIYYIVSLLVYLAYSLWHITGGTLTLTEIEKSASDGSFALTVIASIICLWVYMLIAKLRRKNITEYIANRSVPPIIFVMAAVLAIGCRFLVAVYYCGAQKIEVLLKSIERAEVYSPDITGGLQLLVAMFCVIIVAPLFEEMLFRGLVMGELMKIMRPWAAITVQAILFSVAHEVLFQSIFAFAVGIVLGIVYHRTQSIKTSAICHGVFNASAVLMQESMSTVGNVVFIIAGILLITLSLFYIFANTQKKI